MIKRIKLFTNDKTKTMDALKIIETKLINSGFELVDKKYDLAIAVGGDGTFLRMMNENKFSSDILYVGINLGTLGFTQDVNIDEIDKFIDEIKNNKYSIENVCIGDALIISDKKQYKLNYINEIVIRNENLKVIRFDINIGNNLLEKYVGDALLISTPFGSTAENLIYNGSIVYNSISSLQVTPIGPINSSKYKTLRNSIIVPSYLNIELKFNNSNIFIMSDGNKKKYNHVFKIITRARDKKIKILRLSNYNYESKLNVKIIN